MFHVKHGTDGSCGTIFAVRICSYNIHGGTDAARRPALDRIAQTLQLVAADIVLLQEVDRFMPRSALVDQAQRLATALNIPYTHFYGRLRMGPAAFGNASLSHLPVVSVRRLPLPSVSGEPRCALGLTLAEGTTVWNTHLGLRDSWRETQLGALAAAIGEGSPVIVAGDFNATLDAGEVQRFLQKTGLTPLSEAVPTFPAAEPQHRIDFLLARGFSAKAAGTIADPGSDHCLIWCDLQAE